MKNYNELLQMCFVLGTSQAMCLGGGGGHATQILGTFIKKMNFELLTFPC